MRISLRFQCSYFDHNEDVDEEEADEVTPTGVGDDKAIHNKEESVDHDQVSASSVTAAASEVEEESSTEEIGSDTDTLDVSLDDQADFETGQAASVS